MTTKLEGRFYSLDLIRGLIVILSVYLSNIPSGDYKFGYLRHGEWNGITIMDFILPCFVTIFGTGMAFAYQKGVNWGNLSKRTIRLIIFGLLFNMIVIWEFNLELLRFTGVLQLYAFLGIATVVIMKFARKKRYIIGSALLILLSYGFLLFYSGTSCGSGLPEPSCNPSGVVDELIFGSNHVYQQGARGYDPEGIFTMIAALSNVLIGYWAGTMLLKNKNLNKKSWKQLILGGLSLIILSYIVTAILPYNKKIWTPSFALLTAGSTLGVLGLLHLIFDQKGSLKGPVKIVEAFGRNSFFVYFGKFIVASVMANITLMAGGETMSLTQILFRRIKGMVDYPQLVYALVILLFWTVLVWILHKKRWYVKV